MAFLSKNRHVNAQRPWRRAGAAGMAFLLCAITAAAARNGNNDRKEFSEYDVKAAFLVNFAKFVEWPEEAFPEPDSPFKIGILGENPFGDTLAKLARDQELHGRAVEVEQSDQAGDLAGCHIVFTGAAGDAGEPPDLAPLQAAPVLIVGDRKGFAEQGGVVNFVVVKTKVKFEVNLDQANRHNLKMSSRLLNLAVKVYS